MKKSKGQGQYQTDMFDQNPVHNMEIPNTVNVSTV